MTRAANRIMRLSLLVVASGLGGCVTEQTVVSPLPTLSQSMRPQEVDWSDPEALKKARRSAYDNQKFRTGRFDAKKYKDRKGAYQGNLDFKVAAYQKGALGDKRSRYEGDAARWQNQKARTFTSRYQDREARTHTFRDSDKSYATGAYRESDKGYRDATKSYDTRTLGPRQLSSTAVETANLRTGDKYGTLNEEDVRRVLNKTGR